MISIRRYCREKKEKQLPQVKIIPGNSLNMESWRSAEIMPNLAKLPNRDLRPKLIISPSPIHIPVSAREEIVLHHTDCQTIGWWS